MYRCIVLIFLLCVSSAVLQASVPYADVRGYDSPVSLESPGLFLLNKGDDKEFSSLKYDDSSWTAVGLPSAWDSIYPGWTGICWYRLHLRFPSLPSPHSLVVSLGVIQAADEVYFNGVLIGSSGRVEAPSQYACDKKRLYEIPSHLILHGKDNVLSLRVKGMDRPANGPAAGNFMLDSCARQQWQGFVSDMYDDVFVLIFILFSIYFLMSFFFRGRHGYFLSVSLVCFFMGVYVLLRTQLKYQLGLDFFCMKKLEYMLMPLTVVLVLEFVRGYFRKKRNVIFYSFYSAVVLVEVLFLMSVKPESLIAVNLRINEPVCAAAVLIIGWILFGEMKKKNRTAFIMSLVFAVFGLCVAADIITGQRLIPFPRLDKYGLFLLLVSFSVIIEKRSIKMRAELVDIRQHLEHKVMLRTNELNHANERLQAFNRHISELNDQYHQDFWLAVKVQKAITPHPFGNEYWRIAVRFQPTGAISGDFYDIYKIKGDALGVVLADAAGHGVAAALITMIAKPIFMHAMKRYGASNMKAMMETANSEFLEEIGEISEFLSAQAVRLDHGSVTFVNAGHPCALLCGSGRMREFSSSGGYLGMPELVMPYHQETEAVSAGDTLLMFSDALIEAKNAEGEQFSLARVKDILSAGFTSPDDLVAALSEAVYSFSGTRRLKDDLTIVACQRRHVPEEDDIVDLQPGESCPPDTV
jgi:serine phosphatase RsbU (regulator of sigma subunit)